MHALIFWGFVVLLLQVIRAFGRALDAPWNICSDAANTVGGDFEVAA
jgi:hypothetical protein